MQSPPICCICLSFVRFLCDCLLFPVSFVSTHFLFSLFFLCSHVRNSSKMHLKASSILALLVIGANAYPAPGNSAAALVPEPQQPEAPAVAGSTVGAQADIHHPRLEARYGRDEPQIMCGYCGKRFWNKPDLGKHIKLKTSKGGHDGQPYKEHSWNRPT